MLSTSSQAAPVRNAAVPGAGAELTPWLVGILFLCSGVAALIYQVAWQRLLVVFAGGDVQAVTIIVAAFMLGLGLGHLVGGPLADRRSRWRSLVLFGVSEAAIAAFGAVSKPLYYDGLYVRLGEVAASRPLTTLILVASLLVPTLLMGLSLPLLARAVVGELEEAAPRIGRLYGWNTLGAALGAALATWVLLPRSGMEGAIRTAVVLNTLCALAAGPLALVLRKDVPMSLPKPREMRSIESRWSLGMCLAIYGLSGFIALALEIVWFRLLGVMLKSTAFSSERCSPSTWRASASVRSLVHGWRRVPRGR